MLLAATLSLILSASATDFVPKALYHFGSYEPLMKDVAARTVPERDWSRYIMGDETRFGQKIYRRGLYGTAHPGFSSYFGDRLLENEAVRAPWMIRIAVKDECRREEPLNLATLYLDPRVVRALATFRDPEFPDAASFHSGCYHIDDDSEEEIADFEMVTGVAPATPCEAMADRIFRTLKPKIAVDSIWHQSWYIRDRSCIERIDGSATSNLKWMTEIPGYWLDRPTTNYKRKWNYFQNASVALILMRALIEAPVADGRLLAALKREAKNSDLANPASSWLGHKPGWFSRVIQGWLADYESCRSTRRLQEWKAGARANYDVWLAAKDASTLELGMESTMDRSFCE